MIRLMTDIVAPLLAFCNSGTVSPDERRRLPFVDMAKDDRRAKVTPETKRESKLLAQLWATRSHPSQAEFGETYGIGNQSAVGQFLRGDTPLSLKAARGFAEGLGCSIADFSPRLANEAAEIAASVPHASLSPELSALAQAIERLTKPQREWVLMVMRNTIELAPQTIQTPTENNEVAQNDSPKRRSNSR